MLRFARRALLLVAAAVALAAPLPAFADEDVDLALVIAVDISFSMDPEEQALQRDGFIEAFRSPIVHEAIRRGTLGRIAVVYGERAAHFEQKVIVTWTASTFTTGGNVPAYSVRRYNATTGVLQAIGASCATISFPHRAYGTLCRLQNSYNSRAPMTQWRALRLAAG